MSIDKSQQNHDAIIALLPWFVNKTLDTQQMAIVTDHLEHCEQCQSDVNFLGSVNGAVKTNADTSYRAHATVEQDLQHVMMRIDSDEIQVKSSSESYFQLVLKKVTDLIPTWSAGWQGATAIAGVLAIVISFQFFYTKTNGEFTVLSSSDNSETAIRLSVDLESSINTSEAQTTLQALFNKHSQELSVEKSAGGAYIIEINDAIEVDELNALVLDLNDQASVKRVEILP